MNHTSISFASALLPFKTLFLSADKIPALNNDKVKLFNLYASTEVLWMASKEVHTYDIHLTAGTPKPGTQLYILDENQNLLPQGTIGEICISSNTMAREYLNDSELHARKFIFNPTSVSRINNGNNLRIRSYSAVS